jgi:hypothetical protein
MRVLIVAILMSVCLAAAPASRPSAPAADARPAKPQADLGALHAQAYELLVRQDYSKAKPLLEKVYAQTAPEARSRALVLNHALADATQKTRVMRALKDLTAYLTAHRDPDEPATNILGGALNIAVLNDARLKSSELWQTAFREWDRRNYVLDHSRKGWRRWGTRWLSDDEYAQVQADIKSLKDAVAAQKEITDRAYDRAWSLEQQYNNAVDAKEKARYLAQYLQWYNGNYMLPGNVNLDPSNPNFGQMQPNPIVSDYTNAYMEAQRLGPEMQTAIAELNREMTRLRELESKVIRPQWPTKFEPVDPNGAEAEKPLPTTNPAPTTAPAEKAVIRGSKPLPAATTRKSLYE